MCSGWGVKATKVSDLLCRFYLLFIYEMFFYGVKLVKFGSIIFYAGPAGVSHKDRNSKWKIGFRNFGQIYYITFMIFLDFIEVKIKEDTIW